MNNILGVIDSIINKSKHTNDRFSKIDLVILLTGAKCNFSCKYCFINNCKNESSLDPVIDADALKQVFKEIKYKESPLIAVWAGEPLFNKNAFINLCTLINKELPYAKILIITNGSLLDNWWAEFFKEHSVYINVSHDGPGQSYRGFDFLSSEKHISALQKIQEFDRLNDFNTVIHKYNCSFTSLYKYFINMQNITGICPKNYEFVFELPNLDAHISYGFDYMDEGLVKYVYDNIIFLLENGLNNNYDAIYVGMHSELLEFLKKLLLQSNAKICNAPETLIIDSLGRKTCTRSFFNKKHDIEIRADHIKRCLSCKEQTLCPLLHCQAVKLDDSTCNSIMNRVFTIKETLNNILVGEL